MKKVLSLLSLVRSLLPEDEDLLDEWTFHGEKTNNKIRCRNRLACTEHESVKFDLVFNVTKDFEFVIDRIVIDSDQSNLHLNRKHNAKATLEEFFMNEFELPFKTFTIEQEGDIKAVA